MDTRLKLDQYATWIRRNVTNPRGRCAEVTKEMQEAFPELIRVRGYCTCLFNGPRPHWWLKTAAGDIVDPTAAQFTLPTYPEYEELDENADEPTGMCLDCGSLVYNNNTFCDAICEAATRQFMGLPLV